MEKVDTRHLVVFSTCPDIKTARIIAEVLVASAKAACVNIVSGIESVYQWQGTVEHDEELLLIIKTNAAVYDNVEALILENHPYELPEIVAVSIEAGSAEYLDWIGQTVGTENVL